MDGSAMDGHIGADWLKRFAAGSEPPPTVARELLDDVLEGFRAAGTAAYEPGLAARLIPLPTLRMRL